MKNRLYSLLKFAIGWPLTILAFFFIGKIIYNQAPNILPHITNLNPYLLLAGIVSFIIFYFLRSLIWYRIIRAYGHRLSFKESNYLWAISELKRYTPGNVWSFFGRAVLFSKKGVEKKEIGSGLLIEAEVFIIGCFIISLFSLPFFLIHMPTWITQILCAIVLLGSVLYIFNQRFVQKFHGKTRSAMQFLFPHFSVKENFTLIAISVVALLFFGFGNYFVMSAAFGTNQQLIWQLIGVFALAFVAGYLSIITPAGFGVREGITIFALSRIVSSGLAAFAALFTRILLIVSEVIFIGISYVWNALKSKHLEQIERLCLKYPYETLLSLLTMIYLVYMVCATFLRYDNFYTGKFDLGNMVQTVWNTLHGNFFIMTNPDGVEQVSRLAFHADFILILLAPLYALWQDPRMLLLLQSIIVAAGAYFVFAISNGVLKNKLLSFIFAFSYLINPSVERANLYDFHAVVLATTFLLATFYFYLKRKYWLFLLFAVLAALCKEQIWLIIGLFGVLVMVHHRKWVLGAVILLFSFGMFFYLLEYAIPNAYGANHFALEYYSDYGSSPISIIKSIILSPNKVIHTALEADRIKFIEQIFSPLGYISLAFPFFLIFAGPDLLISILSNNANLHQIYYQYTATMTPFIFISAIYGAWVVLKFAKRVRALQIFETRFAIKPGATIYTLLAFYLLFSGINTAILYGPLPGAYEPNIDMFSRSFPNKEYIDAFIDQVPPDFQIAASNNLGSHLSQREVIYVLPNGIDQADMVLISNRDLYADTTYQAMITNPDYKMVVNHNGFMVFEKRYPLTMRLTPFDF